MLVICISIAGMGICSLLLALYLKKDKQSKNRIYPTSGEIKMATRKQINGWVQELPTPSTELEQKIYNHISFKCLVLEGLVAPTEMKPTAESMTCECGISHPFIHVFGKCGRCIEKYN